MLVDRERCGDDDGHLVLGRGVAREVDLQVFVLQLRVRERMLALEKGVEAPALPPGMFGDLGSKPTPRYLWPRAMRNGLMMLFGGVVLFFAVLKAGGEEGALFMLVLAALGLANLIYAGVVWKQEKDEPPPPRL